MNPEWGRRTCQELHLINQLTLPAFALLMEGPKPQVLLQKLVPKLPPDLQLPKRLGKEQQGTGRLGLKEM